MNENLRRALQALERGATEARGAAVRSSEDLRARIEQTVDEVLGHLEDETRQRHDHGDMLSDLDRQSKDIAEDLRRAERLMRERLGRD
ncbi:MAG TPA: hypothetical protein VKX16_09140 [Chloroflexota bacterium]|nr:hypothetical protein [Chloroflexota bacterium]